MTDSGQYTPETLARKAKMAELLLGQSMRPEKIEHWAQGLAQLGRAGIGGYMAGEAEREQKEGDAKGREFIASLLSGAGGSSTAMAPPSGSVAGTPPSPVQTVPADQFNSIDAMADMKPGTQAMLPRAQGAISSIESGGRYDATGPAIASGPMAGQRAIGKYQIMESNIGPWTKEILGKSMTPQEFAANPDAQDAVFNGKFGKYIEKYGSPEAASRAWFAGEGGMNNPGAKDQLGTTVASYGARFNQGMEGDASLPPGARPTQAVAQPPAVSGNPMTAKIIEALRSKDPFIAKAAQGMAGGLVQKMLTPSDYDIQQRPDGTVIAVNKKNPQDMKVINAPGAGQAAIDFEAQKAGAVETAKEKAKKAVSAPERREQELQVGNIVLQDADRAIDKVEKNPNTTTGMVGPWLATIGGTAANDVKELVGTIKANAGFAELQKMRNNSPTGGALGQVSDSENKLLASTIGSLEQSQSADQFKDNLRRVKNVYLDIVHGKGKGPEREKLMFENKGGDKVRKFNPATGKIE